MMCIYMKKIVVVIVVGDKEVVIVVFVVVILILDCMVIKGFIYKNKVVCYKFCFFVVINVL